MEKLEDFLTWTVSNGGHNWTITQSEIKISQVKYHRSRLRIRVDKARGVLYIGVQMLARGVLYIFSS